MRSRHGTMVLRTCSPYCTCMHFYPMSRSSACLAKSDQTLSIPSEDHGTRYFKIYRHQAYLSKHITDKIDHCGEFLRGSVICTDENHLCGLIRYLPALQRLGYGVPHTASTSMSLLIMANLRWLTCARDMRMNDRILGSAPASYSP